MKLCQQLWYFVKGAVMGGTGKNHLYIHGKKVEFLNQKTPLWRIRINGVEFDFNPNTGWLFKDGQPFMHGDDYMYDRRK